MKYIVEWTTAPDCHPLLVTGLPLSRGVLCDHEQLVLQTLPAEHSVPLWWEIRSKWPDGSARWIFLQAVLMPGSLQYRLSCHEKPEPDIASERVKVTGSPEALQVIPQQEGFRVIHNNRHLFLVQQEIDSDQPAAGTPFTVSILEDSPVAPLYRITNSRDARLQTEFLLRIAPGFDACQLTARYSAYTDAAANINRIRFSIDACTTAQGELHAEPAGTNTGAINPDDLMVRTEHFNAVLVRGKRRGPVSLQASSSGSDSVDLVVASEGSALSIGNGISLRHELLMLPKGCSEFAAIRFPDGYIAGTGVYGLVLDLNDGTEVAAAPGLAAGLSHLLAGALDSAGQTGQEPGILNDGDWLLAPGQYGARGYQAYADNEYDMPYVCYLAHAACNKPAYMDLAVRCSIHMADMDCRCTTGDMLYHGYNETAEDHASHRVTQGDLGHCWTDGLWTAWFWSGDPFARESALALTSRIVRHFKAVALADEFAICERNIGWPLLIAIGAMETGLADPETVSFCHEVITFLDVYTADPNIAYMDPAGPVWWRCALQDGSKPFMLGVLGEALDRYFVLTGDLVAKTILWRIASFIMSLYDPVRTDFSYEYNAYGPNHRQVPAQQLIPLFTRTLLAGLWDGTLTKSCEQVIAAFQASAWTLFDHRTGKDIALMARGLFSSLAMLQAIHRSLRQQADASVPTSSGADRYGWTSISSDWCGAVDCLEPPAYADRGQIMLLFNPGRIPVDNLNRQGLMHACSEIPNQSAISIITFYDRIQVRFYDSGSHLINSLDAFPGSGFFEPGTKHKLRIAYAAPGEARLEVDGLVCSKIMLIRPLSGAFRLIYTGRKPGNWTACGEVSVQADFARCTDLQ